MSPHPGESLYFGSDSQRWLINLRSHDLKAPEKQEPKRIGKRLQRLIAAGTAAATIAGGAATFSGDINEFTDNVLELAEKVGLSRDVAQP